MGFLAIQMKTHCPMGINKRIIYKAVLLGGSIEIEAPVISSKLLVEGLDCRGL